METRKRRALLLGIHLAIGAAAIVMAWLHFRDLLHGAGIGRSGLKAGLWIVIALAMIAPEIRDWMRSRSDRGAASGARRNSG